MVEGFSENLVGGPVPNLVDDVLLDLGKGPGIPDRRAPLGSDTCKFDLASD